MTLSRRIARNGGWGRMGWCCLDGVSLQYRSRRGGRWGSGSGRRPTDGTCRAETTTTTTVGRPTLRKEPHMTPTTNRDEAVQILTAFLSKLFTRAWMPWTTRHAAGVARFVDCLIAAAAEQATASRDDAFLDDLLVAVERPT